MLVFPHSITHSLTQSLSSIPSHLVSLSIYIPFIDSSPRYTTRTELVRQLDICIYRERDSRKKNVMNLRVHLNLHRTHFDKKKLRHETSLEGEYCEWIERECLSSNYIGFFFCWSYLESLSVSFFYPTFFSHGKSNRLSTIYVYLSVSLQIQKTQTHIQTKKYRQTYDNESALPSTITIKLLTLNGYIYMMVRWI